MITESKVIELFCMADDFCKFFDAMMTKYTFKPATKRKYHRAFHPVKGRNHAHYDTFSCFRLPLSEIFIETVNDELKNIAQVAHSRHRPLIIL